jgi:hypothetical protein
MPVTMSVSVLMFMLALRAQLNLFAFESGRHRDDQGADVATDVQEDR